MKNRVILIVCFVFCVAQLCGQSQWLEGREAIMEDAMKTRLTTDFKREFPEFFENDNCPPSFQRTATKKSELEFAIEDTEDYSKKSLNILMRNDCDRFILLDALADYYFPQISEKLSAAGLSTEYRFLPLILTGFNNQFETNYSEAGAWKLDFITARKYGLVVNKDFDERFDFEKSTEAAVKYLAYLEQRFYGDPDKVILAFCHSPLYVTKNILPQDDKNFTFSEDDRALISFFRTARDLFENLQTDDHRQRMKSLIESPTPTPYSHDLSFDAIAEVIEFESEKISQFNPVFKGNRTDTAYSGVSFLLPAEQNLAFETLEDSVVALQKKRIREKLEAEKEAEERMKKGIPDPSTSRELVYRVRSGDVIGKIAQRYGVKVSDIRTWNDLRGNMIYIGQELILYIPKDQVVTKEKSVVERENKAPRTEPKDLPDGDYITYTVKSGESLWLIARNYPGVSAENIMEWNDITEDIKPGMDLKIFLNE
ncbi:LysM peptidoglycan-binding domain-containing protein [Halocola ammonii]